MGLSIYGPLIKYPACKLKRDEKEVSQYDIEIKNIHQILEQAEVLLARRNRKLDLGRQQQCLPLRTYKMGRTFILYDCCMD